jgi:hypothetical protein
MLLHSVEITGGDQPGRVRVLGRVRYDGDGLEEVIWFDLPAALESQLSPSGNPWLVALLPLAVSLQEPLRLTVPVDPFLLEGCRAVLDVWKAWDPGREPVSIEVPAAAAEAPPGSGGTGLFFSGGVDSFYSLLRRNGPGADNTRPPVTDLILIHGADIPLANAEAFNRLRPRMAEVAGQLGVELVDIATNARETRWGRANWPMLSHAALLIAAGLVLEPRFARLLIASSAPYGQLEPYGSHPITDPLFTTSRTRVIHDGADTDRPEKITYIGSHPAVLQHLRVCWIGRNDTNCGRCPKCLNAMMGLELAGTLAKCQTLPRSIDPALYRQVYFESRGTYPAYGIVRGLRQRAWLAGRRDLVALMDQALARSDRLRLTRDVLEGLARRGLIPTRLSQGLIARLFRRSVKY